MATTAVNRTQSLSSEAFFKIRYYSLDRLNKHVEWRLANRFVVDIFQQIKSRFFTVIQKTEKRSKFCIPCHYRYNLCKNYRVFRTKLPKLKIFIVISFTVPMQKTIFDNIPVPFDLHKMLVWYFWIDMRWNKFFV